MLPLTATSAAFLLWLLLGAFALRVVGQLIVVIARPSWLPPMEQWYSGIIAYPILLVIQVVLLAGMALVSLGVSAGWPPLAEPRPELGAVLVIASYVYGAAMVGRYVVRMVRRPDQRWFGGTIPIVFHIVLAAWLLVLGSYLRS